MWIWRGGEKAYPGWQCDHWGSIAKGWGSENYYWHIDLTTLLLVHVDHVDLQPASLLGKVDTAAHYVDLHVDLLDVVTTPCRPCRPFYSSAHTERYVYI